MTEEQLSRLTPEEKMTAVQLLIADLAARILSDDAAIKDKARHDIGALAMTFSNLHQLILSAKQDDMKIVRSIYETYRYQPSEEQS